VTLGYIDASLKNSMIVRAVRILVVILSLLRCGTKVANAVPIQFLMSEAPGVPIHNDSYVITIDDADSAKVNHARAIVNWIESGAIPARSPGSLIVVTSIAAGANGRNRDILNPAKPAWSWHPVGPVSFADFTIEILDGWPSFVESDVDGWITNTGGAIGFWSYTVTQELSYVLGDYNASGEVGLGDLNLVLFNWNSPTVPATWVNQIPAGIVGLPELNGVLFNWGNTASVASIPEPAAGLLAVLGLLAIGIRRRSR